MKLGRGGRVGKGVDVRETRVIRRKREWSG